MRGWRTLSESRRQRNNSPLPDARRVLDERLVPFLVRECIAARTRFADPASPGAARDRSSERQCEAERVISDIHARWLVTPRDDLAGRSPREVLLQKQEVIDFDLQSRRDQWHLLGECPPGLYVDSRAYRHAGFGTHEIVIYYDLVRHLLRNCWAQTEGIAAVDSDVEVLRLEEVREEWLHTISDNALEGLTPAEVVTSERQRIPLAVAGAQAAVDCDCPLCQMMAECGPVFLHLDGCHLEESFAFSFHRTHDEWEAERREWQAVAEQWEHERAFGSRQGSQRASLWDDNQWDPSEAPSLETTPEFLLVAIAAYLCELGLDLKESTESARMVPTLNLHFGNLRDAASNGSDTLLQPTVEQLVEGLQEVIDCRPELTQKCHALIMRLDDFVAVSVGDKA